ncbi:hypothetical protein ACO0RG_001322 [Hanseniaspora osmophila]|uniref:Protein SIP5 n=1 Tax=Hanseniaspora osmophila TaxID=56408 RepID=A0A1E5RNJ1_9ASCO|nr:Protein SIP5 [Hanseniaspora osmophila]
MGNVPGRLEEGSNGSVRSRTRSNSNLSISSSNDTLNSRSRRNSNQYSAANTTNTYSNNGIINSNNNNKNNTNKNNTNNNTNNPGTSSHSKSLGSRRHSHTAASPIATTYNASSVGRQRRAGSLVGSLLASTQHAFGGGAGSSPTTPSSMTMTMSSASSNGATPTRSRASSIFSSSAFFDNPYRKRSTRERQKCKEEHYKGLVVRYDEVVDGGYLAPYGVHDDEHKLDYNENVVKKLIIERKLQPFYLPLDDYEPEWNDTELLKWVRSLTLHQPYSAYVEKYEDLPGIEGLSVKELENSENIEKYLDSSLSKTERKIQRSQIFTARLYKRKILWQQYETDFFLNEKLKIDSAKKSKFGEPVDGKTQSQAQSLSFRCESWVPNDKLMLDLYRNGTECPICFLYYPGPFNISRCCEQPICTECFVQIKRKDPHIPAHENNENNEIDEIDEDDDNKNNNDVNENASTNTSKRRDSSAQEEETDQNGTLISEPTSCPYCATPNFGVVYTPPPFYRRCGINSVLPGEYKGQNIVSAKSATPTSAAASATASATASAASTLATENSAIDSPCVSSTGVSDVILEEAEDGNSAFVSQIARRGSLPAHHESVVTSDAIRPDWEVKLNKARERQKKKYLKATTIHLNNRLVSATELARLEDEMLDKAIKMSLSSNGNGTAANH